MRIKEVKTFVKGLINSIEDHSIPDGAASASLNWITKGDHIELRKGFQFLGTEIVGTGNIDGLHIATKADGTQVPYRKRGRKLEYYDTNAPIYSVDQQQLFENAGTGGWTFGDAVGEVQVGTTFRPAVTADIGKIEIKLRKTGTPTDNVKVEIYADNGSGVPGILLATANEQVAGTAIPTGTTFTAYEFTFDAGTELTADTTYWLIVSRTGSLDGSNYYRIHEYTDGADPYTRGKLHDLNNGVWTSYDGGTFNDFYFKEYYISNFGDWVEVGTDLFPLAAEDDEASFGNYASLAGNQTFVCSPNAGPFKIMVASPGSYTDLTDSSKNFQGYIKIKQNRMTLRNRNADKTGEYGSYIDTATYTTVTAEALGTGDGVTTTFSGTLAYKGGGAVRTCFAITIKVNSVTTLTDDYNGNLKDSSGVVRGTINYTTGDYEITFGSTPALGHAIVADYQWENSNNTGITDFTKATPRTAGQGYVFRQDDGGGTNQMAHSYGDTEYCFHRLKTWALTLTATDTNATNLIYRENVGIPNWRAAVATGDGIYYVDDYDQAEPKFRLLTLNQLSTQVIPVPVSNQLNLQDYRFDKAATIEWGDFIFWACRHKDSEVNNTVFGYNKKYKCWDKFDYYVSCFGIYNGALLAGDSITENVYELFSTFTDNENAIPNSWEGNVSDLDSKDLKKVKKFWVEGEISHTQELEIYQLLDNGEYELIGTQTGLDSNVDTNGRTVLGSDVIGQSTLGGSTSQNIFHYIKEIRLRNGKFSTRKIKYKATNIGFVSVSTQTDYDIILNQQKLPTKYRE